MELAEENKQDREIIIPNKKIKQQTKSSENNYLTPISKKKSELISTSASFKKTFSSLKTDLKSENRLSRIPSIIGSNIKIKVLERFNSAINLKSSVILSKNKTNSFINQPKISPNHQFLSDVKKDLQASLLNSDQSSLNLIKSSFNVSKEIKPNTSQNNVYMYFENHKNVEDIIENYPEFVKKLVKMKKYSFGLKEVVEEMTRDMVSSTKKWDKKFSEYDRNLNEGNNFIRSTATAEKLKKLNYKSLKQAGMKPKKKEKKIMKFRIPGRIIVKEEGKEDDLDKLLSPQIKKVIKLKLKKSMGDFIIYGNKRIDNLSVPRTVYLDNKSRFYKEIMKTCSIASDENRFILRNIINTKNKEFENEKNLNLDEIDRILRKKFYFK